MQEFKEGCVIIGSSIGFGISGLLAIACIAEILALVGLYGSLFYLVTFGESIAMIGMSFFSSAILATISFSAFNGINSHLEIEDKLNIESVEIEDKLNIESFKTELNTKYSDTRNELRNDAELQKNQIGLTQLLLQGLNQQGQKQTELIKAFNQLNEKYSQVTKVIDKIDTIREEYRKMSFYKRLTAPKNKEIDTLISQISKLQQEISELKTQETKLKLGLEFDAKLLKIYTNALYAIYEIESQCSNIDTQDISTSEKFDRQESQENFNFDFDSDELELNKSINFEDAVA